MTKYYKLENSFHHKSAKQSCKNPPVYPLFSARSGRHWRGAEGRMPHVVAPREQNFASPGTVCPGSSDPPEKLFNIFASENEVFTIY